YNLNKAIEDISAQKSGFSIYYDFGVEKYMYYSYLGIDAWSIVTVVDKATITAATTQLAQELTVVAILIMILFPILLVMLVLSMQMTKSQKHAAQMKSAFLANMSHEIRTPMNAIVGISEILLREELSNKQKNYVMNIVNSGNGLLTIINDVLDVSKMESGKFKIVDDEYELESLIYDIVTIMAIKIGDKPIELLVDLDTELPKYIVGDM
ncbi:MAG: histidine kinase dimerization/phospho-acceptor domain-containing protein, partial [Alistipes sp.]